MLTTRSSILLTIAGTALCAGLLRPHEGVAFVALTLLFWLGWQWLGMQRAMSLSTELLLDLSRTIDGESLDAMTLVADQEYSVELTGEIDRRVRGFRLMITDTLPDACQIVDGTPTVIFDSGFAARFRMAYRFKPLVCGRMHLSGIELGLEDTNGMFRGRSFEVLRQQLTVLPFLIRPQTTVSVLKQNNLQIILGHHRHRSAGISAELLGIRDYQPGDPPRSIAWKPTARLGKLMSREFEKEVPIRATVFADMGATQFIGRPGTANIDRVVTAVASTARLLLSDRDPVATVLASESGSTRIPHATGERQLARILHHLLVSADPGPRLESLDDHELGHVIFFESFYRFPELYDKRYSFISLNRRLWSPFRSRYFKIRSRMAPVLTTLLGKPAGFEYRLIHDADAMRNACMEYARIYPVSSVPVHAIDNEYRESVETGTLEQLCLRLMEARSRARDNELFIVIGRLPVRETGVNRLEEVLRVCRAAGHRLIFVDTGRPGVTQEIRDPLARQILGEAIEKHDEFVAREAASRLATLGVRTASLDDPQLMERVAMEIELIRSGKVRSGSARSLVNYQ
ncbi:MAG: DUF58 domain-containing protein [Pirellulaceae bacterium]